jgi:hypothetical protein
MSRISGLIATPALALALGTALPAVAGELGHGVEAIPVVFTSVTPDISPAALCDGALEAVAIGNRVPFQAVGCLRTYVLEPGNTTATLATPSPNACEALLPSLAVGAPVSLGAAVPCVETYVTAPNQMAAR